MKLIIEREATFENNSEMEVKVTQKQLQLFTKLKKLPVLLLSITFLV